MIHKMFFFSLLALTAAASAGVAGGRHNEGKWPTSLRGGHGAHMPSGVRSYQHHTTGTWPRVTARAVSYWDSLTAGVSRKASQAAANAEAQHRSGLARNRAMHLGMKNLARDVEDDDDELFDGDDDDYVATMLKRDSNDDVAPFENRYTELEADEDDEADDWTSRMRYAAMVRKRDSAVSNDDESFDSTYDSLNEDAMDSYADADDGDGDDDSNVDIDIDSDGEGDVEKRDAGFNFKQWLGGNKNRPSHAHQRRDDTSDDEPFDDRYNDLDEDAMDSYADVDDGDGDSDPEINIDSDSDGEGDIQKRNPSYHVKQKQPHRDGKGPHHPRDLTEEDEERIEAYWSNIIARNAFKLPRPGYLRSKPNEKHMEYAAKIGARNVAGKPWKVAGTAPPEPTEAPNIKTAAPKTAPKAYVTGGYSYHKHGKGRHPGHAASARGARATG